MPEIEITEDQRSYIDDLRDELAEEHVGEYGTVRPRDALQFLIDRHERDDSAHAAEPSEPDEDATGSADDEEETDEESAGGSGGPGRLQAMMRLLDEHDDRWEEVESDQGKYAVTLPDGETETVRTKDDVRGLLFKHYR